MDIVSIKEALRRKYEEVFRDEDSSVPPHIYHYTGEQALRSIIGGGCFWCTDLRDVDDKSEGDYAARIIRDVANRKSVGNDLKRVLNQGCNLLGLKDLYQMYIICFCAAPEAQQMWQQYGNSGRGYAIKFDFTVLLEGSGGGTRYALLPITYDRSRQVKMTECILDGAIGDWRGRHLPGRDRGKHDKEVAKVLLTCGLRFKAPQYKHEQEVRLLAFERPDHKRVDTGGKRRIELSYPQKAVMEVVWGPNTPDDSAAVRGFLGSPGFAHIPIRRATLPRAADITPARGS